MAYKSPIEIIQEEARMHYEDAVVKAIQPYLISVNKDELTAALMYDRAQYDNGYVDGRAARDAEIIRCRDCKHHEAEEIGMVYCPKIVGGWVSNTFYCGDAERKDEVEGSGCSHTSNPTR